MTIPAADSEISYLTDGVTAAFTIPFSFDTSADIKVTLTDASGNVTNPTTGFTVLGGAGAPGTITFSPVLVSGYKLVLQDDPSLTQPTDYIANSAFPPESHEQALDRVTRLAKRLKQQVRRALKLSDGDTTAESDLILPAAALRANQFPVFDAAGRLKLSAGTGADAGLRADLANTTSAGKGNELVSYRRIAAETSAAVTPVNYFYEPLDPIRYDVKGDGVTNDSTAWSNWRSVVNQISTTGPLHNYGIRIEPTSFGGQPSNLKNIVLGDIGNTAWGYNSQPLTSGALGNTSYGYNSLSSNVTGQFNTSIGGNNLTSATGLGFTTAIGYGAGYNITTGTSSVYIGFEAGHDTQAGSSNCAVGYSAQHAGLANGGSRDVNQVTAFGTFAAKFNFADNITAIGYGALTNNTGAGNLAVGYQAGLNVTSGIQNVLIGDTAGGNMTTGGNSTIIGFQAGLSLTTTIGYNTYVGALAGFYNTTATQNTAVGYQALGGTSGSNGSGGNTAIGYGAMQLCQNPASCTAVGQVSLRNVTTGGNNIGIGDSAGLNVSSGASNTLVGNSSASTLTTGSNNTCFGKDTNVSAAGATNQNSFGYQATCTGDNQITLGNASIATLRCQQTTITALSDARFKKNIERLDISDDFLDEVEIVTYEWIAGGMPQGKQIGVIAQQLDELQNKYGLQWLGLVDKSNPDRWEATPGKLLFPLIMKTQRLARRVAALEGK